MIQKRCTIGFCLILVVLIVFKNSNNKRKRIFQATYHVSKQTLPDCNPIISNVSHSRFLIDGLFYPQYLPMFLNSSYNWNCLNRNNQSKLILFWNRLFNRRDFNFGIGKKDVFLKHNCPVTNCETTSDKTRLNESSLILFSIWTTKIETLPKWRQDHQRWIFHLYEAQQRTDNYNVKHFSRFNGLFNMSATHRFNSNFTPYYTSHMHVIWEHNDHFNRHKNFLKNKTHFAYQVVSNCLPPSKRDLYIKELQKYVQVDVYGKVK